MEAYPHLETTLSMITVDEQRHPGSMMMDFRNKALDHERRLITYVAENFQIKYDLPSFTHLSQIVQADAMHFAYQTWRRDWGQPKGRKCGGVLVWQLNDCWPTMSWAVVDYYLIKKPGFYAMSRALAPLTVGVSRTCHEWTTGHADPTLASRDTKFDLWIASSRVDPVDIQLNVRFISIRSGKEDLAACGFSKSVVAAPNSVTEILRDQVANPQPEFCSDDVLRKPFDLQNYDPFVIHATIEVDGKVIGTNTAWPQPLKYLSFPDRGVRFALSTESAVAITTERPVKGFVFEETKGMHLSDNGFDLVPGEEKIVTVSGAEIGSLRWTYIGAPAPSLKVSLEK
jgi:beta-mannosidase